MTQNERLCEWLNAFQLLPPFKQSRRGRAVAVILGRRRSFHGQEVA